ncbi:hypothetical protein GC163_01155 [bacterium]|nr:hypothetical protein [bacterium]
MPAASIQQIEQLTFEGPFGLALAALIGLACACVFAFWLKREVNILGWRKAVLFWCLRTTAVAFVLWMLLAPTQVETQTVTTKRTIVFATDISDSMLTVDPPGSAEDIRWELSSASQPTAPPLILADQLAAAVGRTQQQLEIAIISFQQPTKEAAGYAALLATEQAYAQARKRLAELQPHSQGTAWRRVWEETLARMDGPEFEELTRLATSLKKERIPQQTGWREGLPDLANRLTSAQQASAALTTTLAESARRPAADNVTHATRKERVQSVMQQLQTAVLPQWSKDVDVRFLQFASDVSPETAAKDTAPLASTATDSTNLTAIFAAIQRDFPEQPVAGVFVLSDFAQNQPNTPDPGNVAGTMIEKPVYTIPIGNSQPVRDLELQSVFAPAVAMRNDDIVLEARIQAYDCAGELCSVVLLHDGVELARREIALDGDYVSRTVRFEEHVSLVGIQAYQVQIEPITQELTLENNSREVEVNVTRNDLKILIADEFPRWEYRYLTQLFRRDAHVECDELLFHPRPIATGQRAETRTLPVTADEWDHYDVVILGDLPSEHLPVAAQESLTEYLQQRGGTLVLIAGPVAMPAGYQSQPLAEILPVEPFNGTNETPQTEYELRVTKAGHDHPALMIAETLEESRVAWDFVNRYSPLPELSPWRQPRPTAHSLLAAIPRDQLTDTSLEDRSSFLCWQPVGRGRVMYLAGPESYRLRLLRGDRLHYRFWGQLLRWAMASDLSVGSQFVRLRTDKTRYTPWQSIEITVQAQDAERQPLRTDDLVATLSIDDATRSVPLIADPQIPGEYRAQVTGLTPGSYQLSVHGASLTRLSTELDPATASTTIVVQPERSTERIDTRCQRVLAEQLAKVTGGQMIPPTAIAEILELTPLEPLVSTTVTRQPLWVQWKYLWIVFGCLQTEWIIRKWLGVS